MHNLGRKDSDIVKPVRTVHLHEIQISRHCQNISAASVIAYREGYEALSVEVMIVKIIIMLHRANPQGAGVKTSEHEQLSCSELTGFRA